MSDHEEARSEALIHEGPAAEARLVNLGLEDDQLLVRAAHAAEVDRRSCSPFTPSNVPGIRAYGTAFSVVGEGLSTQGWVMLEPGLARMVNKETRIALAVCSGDENVGIRGNAQPKSKHPRGAQAFGVLRSNVTQLALFEEVKHRPIPRDEELITWWLLIYSDRAEKLRAELSLPVGIDADGRLSEWEERILLDVPPLNPLADRGDDEGDEPFQVTVDVRPRN